MRLAKARIAKDYTKKVKLTQGANEAAMKQKVLAGLASEERKAVSNIGLFYRKKLFKESAKKKKILDKGGY